MRLYTGVSTSASSRAVGSRASAAAASASSQQRRRGGKGSGSALSGRMPPTREGRRGAGKHRASSGCAAIAARWLTVEAMDLLLGRHALHIHGALHANAPCGGNLQVALVPRDQELIPGKGLCGHGFERVRGASRGRLPLAALALPRPRASSSSARTRRGGGSGGFAPLTGSTAKIHEASIHSRAAAAE